MQTTRAALLCYSVAGGLQRVADLVQWSVATAPPGVHVLMAGDFKIDCAHLLPTPQIKQLGPTLTIQQIPGRYPFSAPARP
jgi:hypothetical protein